MGNGYNTYMNVLRMGFSSFATALQDPNPVIEMCGVKEAKKRLYDALAAVKKLDVSEYSDNDKELLIKRFGDEINTKIHDWSQVDLSVLVLKVDKKLRAEWGMLATLLKTQMDDLKPLLDEYGKKVEEKHNQTTKEQSIKTYINDDPEGKKLEVIRRLITGKIGKNAALVIYCAMKRGWMIRPITRIVEEEFGNIGSPKGFDAYLRTPEKFKKDEITNMMKNFVLES